MLIKIINKVLFVSNQVVMLQQQRQMIQENDAKHQQEMNTNEAKHTAEISNLKQEITSLKQQDIVKSQEITSLKQQDAVTSQMLNNQSMDIKTINSCTTPRVAFMAVMSNGFISLYHALPSGTYVVYDKVITNTDNSYDPKTGQFKCTTPGVYEFNLNIVVYDKHFMRLHLQINSVKITTVHAGDSGGYADSGSVSAVVLLKKDDVVNVKAGYSGGLHQNINEWQMNTFEGHLVHADACLH